MSQISPNRTLFDIYMTKSQSPEQSFERQSLSPNSSFTKPREKIFCTEENVEQCVAYLNQELNVLGFPSIYDKKSPGNSYSAVRLLNNLYELLQLQVKNNQVKNELEARQQRSDCDNDVLTQCQIRLKGEVDACQREIAQLSSKNTELSKTKKKLEITVKNLKEEIKKMKGSVQHLRKQFEHEIRKKETEMSKMRERIVQLLNDKTKEKCLGMEILNSIQRVDGKRGTWNKGNKHEEDMYRLLINNYEERQKEVIEENNDLRELLKHTEDQLVNLLNKEKQDIETDSRDEVNSDDDCVSVSSFTDGHYQMPFELVREGIEKSIREKWARLKERMDNTNKDKNDENVRSADEESDDRLIKLRNELDKYKYIVIQQEEHIQKLQDTQAKIGKVSIMDDSLLVEEKEKIDKEKVLFREENRVFDEDRKRFTDAAIKLGQERERFNEEKALFLKQQLLNSPSPKRCANGKEKADGDASRPSLQTPLLLGALRSKDDIDITTPSTEDLYNILTLRTNRESDQTPRRAPGHDSPRRLSKTSSQTSGNTEEQSGEVNENEYSARKSKRIGQHAKNIKKALLKQHNSDTSHHPL